MSGWKATAAEHQQHRETPTADDCSTEPGYYINYSLYLFSFIRPGDGSGNTVDIGDIDTGRAAGDPRAGTFRWRSEP